MPPEGPVPAVWTCTFEYDYSVDLAALEHWRHSSRALRAFQRSERRIGIIVSLIHAPIIIAAACVFTLFFYNEPGSIALGVIVGVGLGVLYTFYCISRGWSKRFLSLREQAARETAGASRGPVCRIDAGPGGVRFDRQEISTTMRWTVFDGIVELPEFVLFRYVWSHTGIGVPKRVFASPEEARLAIESLQVLMRDAGAGADAIAAGLLAAETVVCPACGYSLRNARVARCSECGVEHSSFDLHLARYYSGKTWPLVRRAAFGGWWKIDPNDGLPAEEQGRSVPREREDPAAQSNSSPLNSEPR